MSADKDWRITLEAQETLSGRLLDMTFCLRESNSTPLAGPLAAGTVVTDVRDWLKVAWKATIQAADCRAGVIRVRELGTAEPSVAELIVNESGTLASATGTLPWGVCALASLKTNLATRRGRGRFHFPPPLNSGHLANASSWNLAGAYYTNCNAFLTLLMAGTTISHDSIDHTYSLRVWSRRNASSQDVTSALVRAAPVYLRSRITVP